MLKLVETTATKKALYIPAFGEKVDSFFVEGGDPALDKP
jgi:hypothetical protein